MASPNLFDILQQQQSGSPQQSPAQPQPLPPILPPAGGPGMGGSSPLHQILVAQSGIRPDVKDAIQGSFGNPGGAPQATGSGGGVNFNANDSARQAALAKIDENNRKWQQQQAARQLSGGNTAVAKNPED